MSALRRRGARMTRALAASAVLLVASTAMAGSTTDETRPEARWASPRWGSFEASLSGYRPSIDGEFGGAASPYDKAFGSGRHYMVRVDGSYSLIVNYGTLDVGLGIGFTQMNGHGLLPDGTVSSDLTRLRILPVRALVTYRFDVPQVRYGIPLVPFVRLTLDRYWWWAYGGAGSIANAGGLAGNGATMGWSYSGGLALLLDFIDPGLARSLDQNTGINHTYLFVEFTKSYIDDFGSAKSWDLSNDRVTVSGGLLFAF